VNPSGGGVGNNLDMNVPGLGILPRIQDPG
jgi:hypothetical protein